MSTGQDSNDVEISQLEPQAVVSIRGTVPIAQLGPALGDRLQTLIDYLQRQAVQSAGPPFVRYHSFGDDLTDFELGLPVAQPVAGDGPISAGSLPGGAAICTWHIGAHDRLGEAYARLQSWLAQHGRAPAGPGWEIYCWIDPAQSPTPDSWPDAAHWRTQLVQPLA